MDRTRLLYAELCAYCNHQIHGGCIRPGQLPPLAWRVVEELTYRVG